MILAQREMLIVERSEAKVRALEIERLKLLLAKARREVFGQSVKSLPSTTPLRGQCRPHIVMKNPGEMGARQSG